MSLIILSLKFLYSSTKRRIDDVILDDCDKNIDTERASMLNHLFPEELLFEYNENDYFVSLSPAKKIKTANNNMIKNDSQLTKDHMGIFHQYNEPKQLFDVQDSITKDYKGFVLEDKGKGSLSNLNNFTDILFPENSHKKDDEVSNRNNLSLLGGKKIELVDIVLDENQSEAYKIALSKSGHPRFPFWLILNIDLDFNLYKSIKLDDNINEIEQNSLLKISYYCFILNNQGGYQKRPQNYSTDDIIESISSDLIKKYIIDKVLAKDFHLKISSNQQKNDRSLYFEHVDNINILTKSFNNYISMFNFSYDRFFIKFSNRGKYDFYRILLGLGLNSIYKILMFDLYKLLKLKTFSCLPLLFPEIILIVSVLEPDIITFPSCRQIHLIIGLILFKFLLLKENLLEDFRMNSNDYSQSLLLTKFVLNVRTLLVVVLSYFYYKSYQTIANTILVRLFFNFIRVKHPECYRQFDFDEYFFQEISFNENLTNNFLLSSYRMGRGYKPIRKLLISINIHSLILFSCKLNVSMFRILRKNFKQEFADCGISHIKESQSIIDLYNIRKRDFYHKLLECLE